MTTGELFEFIQRHVPTFIDPVIIEMGTGYHYTSNWQCIQDYGGFLGAPINQDLDCTQTILNSPPATHDPGVVFAYEKYDDAREEGFGLDIIQIEFRSAIKALHGQENNLAEFTDEMLAGLGLYDNSNRTPETLIILNSEIINFKLF